jgi:ATP-dependent Zn protease
MSYKTTTNTNTGSISGTNGSQTNETNKPLKFMNINNVVLLSIPQTTNISSNTPIYLNVSMNSSDINSFLSSLSKQKWDYFPLKGKSKGVINYQRKNQSEQNTLHVTYTNETDMDKYIMVDNDYIKLIKVTETNLVNKSLSIILIISLICFFVFIVLVLGRNNSYGSPMLIGSPFSPFSPFLPGYGAY